MEKQFTLAAIQMVSQEDVAANRARAAELIARAADGGARLLALPEYFPLMSARDDDKLALREQDGVGEVQDFLRELARRHQVWIAAGTIALFGQDADKLRNSLLLYDDKGERVARYDKIHLFGFDDGEERFDEARLIEAGDQVVCVDTPLGRIGLAVCYDLRFPELFRSMRGVDVIILPAAFTWRTGQAHWEVLLRARAIENQCYVLAAAQGGVHAGGRKTWGQSLVCDAWGRVLAQCESGEGIASARFERSHLEAVRRCLPALQHRVLF